MSHAFRKDADLALGKVPVVASSKPHIWFLVLIWFPLVPVSLVWPHLIPVTVQLALGNHTNVISAAASSIAAGAAAKAHVHAKRARENSEEQLRLSRETHELMHTVHAQTAADLGHVPGVPRPQ